MTSTGVSFCLTNSPEPMRVSLLCENRESRSSSGQIDEKGLGAKSEDRPAVCRNGYAPLQLTLDFMLVQTGDGSRVFILCL